MTPLQQQTNAEIIREWALLNQHSNKGADHIIRNNLSDEQLDKLFPTLGHAKQWAARVDKKYRDEAALAGNRFGV